MHERMKAARLHRRDGAEGIVYEDAPRPDPGEGDALVRVHAAGITPTELTWSTTWTTRDGKDRVPVVPSHEVSGVVEALRDGVREVQVGDAVYALLDFWRDGAAAEYVAGRAADLAPKPRSIDHAHAAAIPLSGLTAWQALFDHAGLSRGQRVLIHGGAGGVGTFAVQLAHWCGAHVTTTASADSAEFLRQLGADEVIDYTRSTSRTRSETSTWLSTRSVGRRSNDPGTCSGRVVRSSASRAPFRPRPRVGAVSEVSSSSCSPIVGS